MFHNTVHHLKEQSIDNRLNISFDTDETSTTYMYMSMNSSANNKVNPWKRRILVFEKERSRSCDIFKLMDYGMS